MDRVTIENGWSTLNMWIKYIAFVAKYRLNGLAMLCIEKNILGNIDFDTIINDFASRNARRQCFR